MSEVDAWIREKLGATPLTEKDLEKYIKRSVVAGWRIAMRCGQETLEIDIVVDDRFPWKPPLAAFANAKLYGIWPHVESDNFICLFPSQSEVDPYKPLNVLKALLGELGEYVERQSTSIELEDFKLEWLSYWQKDSSAPTVHMLAKPIGPSRHVRIASVRGYSLVGEDDAVLKDWLENRFADSPGVSFTIEDGLLIWLASPFLPSEQPRTAADVLRIAEREKDVSSGLLRQLVAEDKKRITVVFGTVVEGKSSFSCIVLSRPKSTGREHKPLSKGFREGRVPNQILELRYLGATKAIKAGVSRVDREWIHGRGQDQHQEYLASKTVALVGLGSIGSSVATLLASTGINRFVFIDPDVMESANVGRHALGMPDVGKKKVDQIKARLRQDYPHIEKIESYPLAIEKLLTEQPDILNESDLLISTVGSWGVEGMLNEWHLARRSSISVLYGWTEEYACAGHALLVNNKGGCLACHLTEKGGAKYKVTDFETQTTLTQEPGCGAMFQPYGPIELQQTISLISELALDHFLGMDKESVYRIWACRESRLKELDGSWTESWKSQFGTDPCGGRIQELSSIPDPLCHQCG